MLRKIKNKRAGMMEVYIVELIIAAACIVVLLLLGYAIYSFFIKGSKEQKQAEHELGEIIAVFKSLSNDKPEYDYILLTAQNWWIFNEEYGNICDGNFCLCMCKNKNCKEGPRACVATNRFVSIRAVSEDGIIKEQRIMQIKSPFSVKIKLAPEISAYPFNGGKPVVDYWLIAQTTTPLFFRFDKKWAWSPDLTNWMDVNTLKVSGGYWKDLEPAKDNAEFISFFSRIAGSSEDAGDNFLKQSGVHKSEGVYTIDVPYEFGGI